MLDDGDEEQMTVERRKEQAELTPLFCLLRPSSD
jgi:hypothetical protein